MIATHSPAFLNAGQECRFVEVTRTNSASELRSFSPGKLRAYSKMARRLGFDRGELLATRRVLLFVEGRADQAVLEALFPQQLATVGICVVPMHTASRASGVADSELLTEFVAAKVAIWLDHVHEDLVRGLGRVAGFGNLVYHFRNYKLRDFGCEDRQGRNSRLFTNEEGYAASLTMAAARNHRDIELLPHPGKDIVDLLDDAVMRDLYPNFPGHSEARAQAPEGSWPDPGGSVRPV